MPTRAYECESCGDYFEQMEKMDERPPACCRAEVSHTHPRTCGGKLKKILFPVPGRVRGGTPKFHQ
jgi:predicted nucleic acid-binding Zn ribbon protein